MAPAVAPKFFENPRDFRKWLEKNYDKKKEVFVGFYKIGTGKKTITWPESVDEALCFGWIDGVRKSIDEKKLFYTVHSPQTNQHLECNKYWEDRGTHEKRTHAPGRYSSFCTT